MCRKAFCMICGVVEVTWNINNDKLPFLSQVGIELVPRDYDMNSPEPFEKEDIVSLVPVHKVILNTMLLVRTMTHSILSSMNW